MSADSAKPCPRCGTLLAPGSEVCLVCALGSIARDSLSRPGPEFRQAPRTFQGYEIVREIGRGGMGVVYEAWQPALKRTVALKIILAGDIASEEAREQFAREAEALARNRHPGVVPIYDFGESDGRCFYTMQLIEGESLARRLESCLSPPLFPPKQAARLVARVARALHVVHENGIVHLDVSPENILLDEQGEPWISDFGLACFLGESAPTRSYVIIGKPDYMAPELTSGRRTGISTRCDIFSVGAILYELLSGRRPFSAENAIATIERVRLESPPALPRRTVDQDLETICLKCLEKSPGDRYETAEALAADLESWLQGAPIRARPVSPATRVWKWVLRHPLRASLAGALVGLILLPTAVAAYFYAVIVPETARTHPTVGRDRGLNGFAIGLETGRVDRVSMNFDSIQFRSRGRPAVLFFTNVPPAALDWVAKLQARIMADIIGAPDDPRSPVIQPGVPFTISPRGYRDRAYYVAPLGWQGQEVLERAPNAQICITLLDPEDPWPDRR